MTIYVFVDLVIDGYVFVVVGSFAACSCFKVNVCVTWYGPFRAHVDESASDWCIGVSVFGSPVWSEDVECVYSGAAIANLVLCTAVCTTDIDFGV